MTIDAYEKEYADADPKPDYTVIEPTEQVLQTITTVDEKVFCGYRAGMSFVDAQVKDSNGQC